MKTTFVKKIALALCVFSFWSGYAQAGVVVGGTRVVYDGAKREASLSISNPDKTPYLIQSWADNDGPDGKQKAGAKPPFVVTPPLFRLEPRGENLLRIIRTGGALPEDRESVFWLNVKSLPSAPQGERNVLQIAVKTRIKLFYRPGGLPRMSEDSYQQVSFQRQGNQLQVSNPTPYFLSFFSLKVNGQTVDTTNVMVPPKGSASYRLPASAAGGQVSWQLINDYGGTSKVFASPLK
ncbi:Chaperone protein fimC precursor [Serratia rubidaea]|uniref:fimbrial biogenesis chaperone n=1 Tax=Serratia rubidaea TaxID=61652 RepID=UPI0006C74443|nr:molecular chaperone [Serratia rubidaea]QPR64285.1 molecular chaperone [Serratia rubidaea]CAI1068827.1 Chaperone protein fimC precursor [Serratia rubidaea]CAI1881947.1 Chaperone protein fimC precursor [Serratia rubidaea]HAY0638360.1 molecular chaperone [Serratia rubidaea]